MKFVTFLSACFVLLLLTACGQEEEVPQLDEAPQAGVAQAAMRSFLASSFSQQTQLFAADAEQSGRREAYFGDLHVHTAYSFDAFAFGTIATPMMGIATLEGRQLRIPQGTR